MRHFVSKLDNIITYFFAAVFFFVPLVLWPNTSEVFEFNKMMLTYLFSITIFTAFVVKWILQKQITIKRTPLDYLVIFFLTSQVLSTIFSINPHTSFWGYYSRFHGGLASSITYIGLFYLLVTHLFEVSTEKRKFRLQVFILSILSSACLVSIYGVLERLGIDKNIWVQDVQNRVFSTLGQPNWLSAYLAALLPLPIYLALYAKEKKESLIYALVASVFLATIYFTKSRSGIAATAVILVFIFLQQLSRKIKHIYLLLPVAIFLAIYLKPQLFANLIPVNDTTQLNQLVDQDNQNRVGGSDSMIIRQVVWQGAIDLFKRHPLLGTGVETFAYSYYWTRPTSHNLLSEWDFLYNKAHNEYLNYLATTGILGFTSISLLTLSITLLFIQLLRQTPKNPYLWSFLIGFLSIIITNYFGFSVVPVAILFFTFPALALASSKQELTKSFVFGSGWQLTKKQARKQHESITTYQYLLIGVLSLLALYCYITIINHWLADLSFNKGRRYSQAGYIGEAIPHLEKSTKLYPNEPTYKAQLAEGYASAALALHQQNATSSSDIYAQKSLDLIDATLKFNPWHLNFLKSKAKVELTIAEFDPSYYERALHTLLKATQLAPSDAKILYNVAVVYETLGQNEQAINVLTKTLELKPDHQQARTDLIQLKEKLDKPSI